MVVDTLSGSTTVFGETNNFPTRMVLIYDGIHYDALYDTREDGSEVTVHSVNDERYIINTYRVCRYYTQQVYIVIAIVRRRRRRLG